MQAATFWSVASIAVLLAVLVADISTVAGHHIHPAYLYASARRSIRYAPTSRLTYWPASRRASRTGFLTFVKAVDLNASPNRRWLHLDWLNATDGRFLRSPSARVRIPVNSPLHSLGSESKQQWSYTARDGPATWPSVYPTCSGIRQSPINIQTSRVHFRNMKASSMISFLPQTVKLAVIYDGATVRLTPKSTVHVMGVGQGGEVYTLAEIHLHWSSRGYTGSEHAVNGVKFPLEMHAVCYKSKYGSKDVAQRQKDGLASLGVFFDIGTENRALWAILAAPSLMNYVGEEVPTTGLDLRSLFPVKLQPFFRYHGSKTTPPCIENVTWTIFEHVQTLSNQQFRLFQDLRRGHLARKRLVVDNVRPIQPLYNRPVWSNNVIFSK